MKPITLYPIFFLITGLAQADIKKPTPEALNAQIDFNRDKVLEYDEVIFGLTRKWAGEGDLLGAQKAGHAPKAGKPDPLVQDAWLDLKEVALPLAGSNPERPRYSLGAINPRALGLEKMVLPAPTTEEIQHERYLREFNYKLRRSEADLDKEIGDAYAQGMLFSYGRDNDAGRDLWTARGVAAIEYSVFENPEYHESTAPEDKSGVSRSDSFFLRSKKCRFSTAFDRVTVQGTNTGEVNKLDFAATGAYSWHLPRRNPTGILGLDANFSGHYATDFDFEEAVYAATVDITPRTKLPGHGVYKFLGQYRNRFNEECSAFAFRWDLSLHAEIGQVEDAGSTPGVLAYDTFGRAGGKASVDILIYPDALQNRLSGNVSYTHYETISGDAPDTHLFSASLQYVFATGSGIYSKAERKEGEVPTMTERDVTWTLRVEYTNGTAPLLDQEEDLLVVGIGVAF